MNALALMYVHSVLSGLFDGFRTASNNRRNGRSTVAHQTASGSRRRRCTPRTSTRAAGKEQQDAGLQVEQEAHRRLDAAHNAAERAALSLALLRRH